MTPSHRLFSAALPAGELPARPGTYALILRNRQRAVVQVGRRGTLRLARGWYVYVGSALGPGGLRARVGRHARQAKRTHWHIDYVTPHATPHSAWCCVSPRRMEHTWAQALGALEGVSALPGFGCSDCSCISHLFFSPTRPDFAGFCAQTGLAR